MEKVMSYRPKHIQVLYTVIVDAENRKGYGLKNMFKVCVLSLVCIKSECKNLGLLWTELEKFICVCMEYVATLFKVPKYLIYRD